MSDEDRAGRFVHHHEEDYAPYRAQMDANARDPEKLRQSIASYKELVKTHPAYREQLEEVEAKLAKLLARR